MKASHFSPDTREFIILLGRHGVRYVIVGGEAVIYHGHARLTGDVDFFCEATPENADRLFNALSEFWKTGIPGVATPSELLAEGVIVQFGVPPNRIDLVNRIDGVSFDDVWSGRVEETLESDRATHPVYIIGIDEIIKNKSAAGRHKDLDDLAYLLARRKLMKP